MQDFCSSYLLIFSFRNELGVHFSTALLPLLDLPIPQKNPQIVTGVKVPLVVRRACGESVKPMDIMRWDYEREV
jgi:hypothetical protein